MHFLHAYQLKANFPLTTEYPRIYLSDTEKHAFAHLKNPFVVLHLDTWSEKNFRQVYGIDWEKIVEYLSCKNFDVIQIGKNPLHIPGIVSLRGPTCKLVGDEGVPPCSFHSHGFLFVYLYQLLSKLGFLK